ncbi:hypothetical protein, partial [Niastella koreensis]
TISDKKFGVPSAGSSLIAYYEPDIVTAQDYYPFGMMSRVALPNSNVPYKFGFNGQEMNNDVKGGLGNSYTAQYWEYDSRIGRRWNLDPKSSVSISEYSVFNNCPILFKDPLGDTVAFQNNGVSPEEFAQTQQEIQLLRKHSRSFNRVYKDLDRSTETWTFQISNEAGGGEDHKDPHVYRLGRNWKDADDALGNQMLNRLSHYAHEFGHAWRRSYDLDFKLPDHYNVEYPDYVPMFAPSAKKASIEKENAARVKRNFERWNKYNEDLFDVYTQWEKEASNIQNVVLSELIKTHLSMFSGVKLRNTYDLGPILDIDKVTGKKTCYPQLGTIQLLTPPRDASYYMNNNINIHLEYNVKPR